MIIFPQIVSFISGLLFGSFANVYFIRHSKDLSVISPRSSCPHCHQLISWFDNIPVISFLLLKGKCRNCHAKISIQYPLVELGMGALFLATAVKFNHSQSYVIGSFILFVFIVFLIGGIDLTTYFKFERKFGIIPDHLTVSLLVTGLGFSFINPLMRGNPWHSLYAALLIGAVLFSFRWIAGIILKQEALGLGDVKLMAGVAAWLGWEGAFLALFLGSILGTILSLVLLKTKKINRKSAIPFGPFLAFGALSALFLQ